MSSSSRNGDEFDIYALFPTKAAAIKQRLVNDRMLLFTATGEALAVVCFRSRRGAPTLFLEHRLWQPTKQDETRQSVARIEIGRLCNARNEEKKKWKKRKKNKEKQV